MTKIYQGVVDNVKGDCIRAVVASLLDKDLLEVPHFLEYESWFSEFRKYLSDEGYKFYGMLHNAQGENVLEEFHLRSLKNFEGIDGYFYGSVYSPMYFDLEEYRNHGVSATHAVVIDTNYNIVHDPNPFNKEVKIYPLAEEIGHNGIINVWLIRKK